MSTVTNTTFKMSTTLKATSKILTALKMTLNICFLEEVQREEDKG